MNYTEEMTVKDYFNNYRDEYNVVYINDYLNLKNKELENVFKHLTQCTEGFVLTIEYDEEDDTYMVEGNESHYSINCSGDETMEWLIGYLINEMANEIKKIAQSIMILSNQ